ncbi:MAG: T9SS type B sorting domain-containing protein [Leeuwenhoekiella sp.]
MLVFSQLGFCTGDKGLPILEEKFGTGSEYGPALSQNITTYKFVSDLPFDGQYTISSKVGQFPSWHQTEDHTPDDLNGKALIVNADVTSGQFYKRKVSNLCENTSYEFSAWLLNVYDRKSTVCRDGGIPVEVRFEIWNSTDTQLLAWGNTEEIPATNDPQWNAYGLIFETTPGQTDIILKMINNGSGGCGNDLAIDDIVFHACGSPTTIASDLSEGDSISICAAQAAESVLLRAENEGNPAYQWQKSEDKIIWQNVSNQTSSTFTVPITAVTSYYRVNIAQDINSLGSDFCSFFSKPFKVEKLPTPPAPKSTGDVSTCQESTIPSLEVTAGDDDKITWYEVPKGGQAIAEGAFFSPKTAGTFYAEAENKQGCKSTTRTPVVWTVATGLEFDTEKKIIQSCPQDLPLTLAPEIDGASYIWSTGETTKSINTQESGTYTVTVTGNSGCTGSKTFEVEIFKSPEAPSNTGDVSSCTTDAIPVLQVQALNTSDKIIWYKTVTGVEAVATGSSYQPEIPGTYFAESLSATGCVSVKRTAVSWFVEPDNFFETTTENITVCPEEFPYELDFDMNAASYLWSTGESTKKITISEAGVYSITVTNSNGCEGSKEFSVEMQPIPESPTSAGDVITCSTGADAVLEVRPADAADQVFWFTSETSDVVVANLPTFQPNTPGNYYAESRSSNGCSSSIRTVVNWILADPITFEDSDEKITICQDGFPLQIDAGVGATSYLWNTGATTKMTEIDAAGDYVVTVTNEIGCESEKRFEVTVLETPQPPLSTGNVETCDKNNLPILEVQATDPTDEIFWYTTATSNVPVAISTVYAPEEPGAYFAEARSASGCSSSARTVVTWKISPPFDFDDDDEEVLICNGELPYTLSAGISGSMYQWNTDETTKTIEVLVPGDYYVEVTNSNGCSKDKKFVVRLLNDPILAENNFSKNGDIVISTVNTGDFEFSVNGDDYHISPEFVNQPAGLYTVFARNRVGCEAQSKTFYHLNIPKFITPNNDGINDYFSLPDLDNFTTKRIRIFDRYGKLMISGSGNKFSWQPDIRNSRNNKQDYWYEIIIEDKTYIGHFSIIL